MLSPKEMTISLIYPPLICSLPLKNKTTIIKFCLTNCRGDNEKAPSTTINSVNPQGYSFSKCAKSPLRFYLAVCPCGKYTLG